MSEFEKWFEKWSNENVLLPENKEIARAAYEEAEMVSAKKIADLENKIEALQEERGDLLIIIDAIGKAIAPLARGERKMK